MNETSPKILKSEEDENNDLLLVILRLKIGYYLGASLYNFKATREKNIFGSQAANPGGKFPLTEKTVEN